MSIMVILLIQLSIPEAHLILSVIGFSIKNEIQWYGSKQQEVRFYYTHKKSNLIKNLTLSSCQLHCLRYENSNLSSLQSFSGLKSTECFQIDMYAAPVVLNDNHIREYTVSEGRIEPGFAYTPGSNPASRLNITLGTNSEMQGAWFEPINYLPQLYEKIEWGVKLPDAVEQAIDNWIHNDQYPLEPPLTPALNPFDPEQIDLKADISWNVGAVNNQQPVFGFFYQPFTRNITSQNKNAWDWDLLSNDYTFRIRWAATNTGLHSVSIRLDAPGFGNWELLPFEFIATSNDPSNSFVSINQSIRKYRNRKTTLNCRII